jgi:hypothetical protein
MDHVLWEVPLGIFLISAFVGLAIAAYKFYKNDQKEALDEREEASRRHNELKKLLVDAERDRSIQNTPKLFLKYAHAGSEFESFSGLIVGNHGELAYGVRIESERRRGLGLQFHDQGIILEANQLHRVELTAVSWEDDSVSKPPRKFSMAKGKQLSALFDKLNEVGEEETIAVTIRCEDHQRKPLEFNWCIKRDQFRNISCDRRAE